MAVGGLIHTLECGEEVRDVFGLDADTRICDRIDHVAEFIFLHLALNGKRYCSFLGVLDGIVDYVDEDLLDSDFVSDEFCRYLGRYVDMEVEFLFLSSYPQHAYDV